MKIYFFWSSPIFSVKTETGNCAPLPFQISGHAPDIFFVFTRAMWGSHTIFMLLAVGGPAKFLKNSSRKTGKQTFSSIPRASLPQVKGAKISLKNGFSSCR